jgi:hypothetical protein
MDPSPDGRSVSADERSKESRYKAVNSGMRIIKFALGATKCFIASVLPLLTSPSGFGLMVIVGFNLLNGMWQIPRKRKPTV